MNESPDPTTGRHGPFAAPSYEPRFAIDHPAPDAAIVAVGLALQLRCQRARGADPVFTAYRVGPDRLVVAAHGGSFLGPLQQARLFEGLDPAAASARIVQWLETDADYGEAPWFDGGEARGFRMYHVPWNQPPAGLHGGLIVEPKWFEIHK